MGCIGRDAHLKNFRSSISELKQIPGVGQSIAQDLVTLGYFSITDLQGQNPEKMYRDLENLMQAKICRCMLYVFRCAVYYASTQEHDPELLKWWNWKD